MVPGETPGFLPGVPLVCLETPRTPLPPAAPAPAPGASCGLPSGGVRTWARARGCGDAAARRGCRSASCEEG